MMRRLALSIWGSFSVFVLVGCPGGLSNPEDFTGAGGGQARALSSVLVDSCGTSDCHDSDQPAAGLDFVSAGVEGRVVNVPSVSTDPLCQGAILVVAGDPDGSYLFQKVLNAPGICGLQMPIIGNLGTDDIETLREWIIGLGAPPVMDEPDGGSPDGG